MRKEKKIKKIFKSRVLQRERQNLWIKSPGDTVVVNN